MLRSSAITMAIGIAFCAAPLAACDRAVPGYALQARGGTYVDGTGRLGLTLLATLRDGDGVGPSGNWTGTLVGPAGSVGGALTYGAAGSWTAAWWPDEPGYAGSYALALAPEGGDALEAAYAQQDGTGIAPPQPTLAEGGTSITWGPVAGAMSYECRVFDPTGMILSQVVSSTTCDLGSLQAGAYAASVLAYSADLIALGASDAREPTLPARLDVSEARLALARTDGGAPPAALGVAGGAFSDGTAWTGRGLAVWVSLLNGDGTPTGAEWTVDVVGPGLTAEAPLRFTYPANFSGLMVWASEVPATPGSFGLVARSSEGSLARPFTLGAIPTLGAPTTVFASAGAQGSADVSWTGAQRAASYLVSARHRATGAHVMSQWVAGTSAVFPADTFLAEETYDVFVAATDADMVGGSPPAPFAITQNTYEPASFVAR
jgi:hypothetical protein